MDNITNETTQISYQHPVIIQGINGDQPFDAKIDTGADVCSLHATDISVNNQMVSFAINHRRYTMPMHKTQSIKQADSNNEQRPVVLLTFIVSQQTIPNIECNLNDRSGMMSDLLIGRNLLDKHDFVIHTGGTVQQNEKLEIEEQDVEDIKSTNFEKDTAHMLNELNEFKKSVQRLMHDLYKIKSLADNIKPDDSTS